MSAGRGTSNAKTADRQRDEGVDTENCDGCFRGKLEALDLANARLENTSLAVVANNTAEEVQTNPAKPANEQPAVITVRHMTRTT